MVMVICFLFCFVFYPAFVVIQLFGVWDQFQTLEMSYCVRGSGSNLEPDAT